MAISTAARDAAVQAVVSRVDLGSGSGLLVIYDDGEGAGIPPSAEAAPTGQPLCVCFLSEPAFAAPVNGVSLGNQVFPATINVQGIAAYFRVLNSNGAVELQGNVGLVADAPALVLSELQLMLNGTVVIDSMQLSVE